MLSEFKMIIYWCLYTNMDAQKSLHRYTTHYKDIPLTNLLPVKNGIYKYELIVSPQHSLYFSVTVWKSHSTVENTSEQVERQPSPGHVVTAPCMPTWSLIRRARICLIQPNESAATGRDDIYCNAWEQIHFKLSLNSQLLALLPICPVHLVTGPSNE